VKQEPIGICGNVFDVAEEDKLPTLVRDNCYSCHGLERKIVATSFRHIRWRKLPHKNIVQFIKNPRKFKHTSEIKHPRFDFLTHQQIDSIASWLDTL
jgi:cytochrome c553